MRKTIKILALLLVITMLWSIPVYAAESDAIMPCETDMLDMSGAELYVTSGNEIQIWFTVVGAQILDKIGALQIDVQRSSDRENWTTMQTYKCTNYTNMMASGTSGCTSYVTYYGEYGYYYRAKVNILGQKGLTFYTKTIYTASIYLGN